MQTLSSSLAVRHVLLGRLPIPGHKANPVRCKAVGNAVSTSYSLQLFTACKTWPLSTVVGDITFACLHGCSMAGGARDISSLALR
ncbi:hypothetical protein ABBQ38_001243 [Trebouxia sp. C0009 RCD-2024]